MYLPPIRRVSPGEKPSAAHINQIVDAILALSRIRGIPPISISDDDSGPTIRLDGAEGMWVRISLCPPNPPLPANLLDRRYGWVEQQVLADGTMQDLPGGQWDGGLQFPLYESSGSMAVPLNSIVFAEPGYQDGKCWEFTWPAATFAMVGLPALGQSYLPPIIYEGTFQQVGQTAFGVSYVPYLSPPAQNPDPAPRLGNCWLWSFMGPGGNLVGALNTPVPGQAYPVFPTGQTLPFISQVDGNTYKRPVYGVQCPVTPTFVRAALILNPQPDGRVAQDGTPFPGFYEGDRLMTALSSGAPGAYPAMTLAERCWVWNFMGLNGNLNPPIGLTTSPVFVTPYPAFDTGAVCQFTSPTDGSLHWRRVYAAFGNFAYNFSCQGAQMQALTY